MAIYHLDASARLNNSTTRQFTEITVAELKKKTGQEVVRRDLGKAEGLKFVDDVIVGGIFTPEDDRSPEQVEALKASDQIIKEAIDNDIWVIGLPIYNFSIPATFKTWADMVARARKTFKYTENGPVGLLENKKVIAVIASGGTEIDSQIDFCTPWLRQFMGFLGISDLTIIKADRYNDSKKDDVVASITKAVESYGN
ncbi:MAG: NAD(P)H-dependent oxidoreductase [Bdellovibrionales bacterium]|nr:NAD(P)H-dependent oxidoreductase [Bdellovibrionales bacterium]NQZ18715.1 NAD(P)H-dependent oxidoreductase [Bdellovibrionales bacterium]